MPDPIMSLIVEFCNVSGIENIESFSHQAIGELTGDWEDDKDLRGLEGRYPTLTTARAGQGDEEIPGNMEELDSLRAYSC
jgi:hypothetical protein